MTTLRRTASTLALGLLLATWLPGCDPEPCNAETCAEGCCQGGKCMVPDPKGIWAQEFCGLGGTSCLDCGIGNECRSGKCWCCDWRNCVESTGVCK